ncbi:MAG: N-acetyltransferase family protein [Chloroflexi bacterium]|nr:MAG: N-acetyltransferase family protein [Chloroflexota bacterium]
MTMDDCLVRPATAADAVAIAEIYNEGITRRIATFETRLRTPADIEAWLAQARFPFFVAQVNGTVVAWAAASEYRPRECYRGIAEFSVYVREAFQGRGLGRAVMEALIGACAQRGYWKLVSRIFVENTASRALCRRLGFREVGIYERHGQLDGVWRDVVIVEKCL